MRGSLREREHVSALRLDFSQSCGKWGGTVFGQEAMRGGLAVGKPTFSSPFKFFKRFEINSIGISKKKTILLKANIT